MGLARAIGLHKGTLGSRYLQLYTAFTISMLLHEWCMFNAIHDDAGEFRFFEDFVQWCWRRLGCAEHHPKLGQFLGYTWTFMWFSYCLPPFVRTQRAVGIMGGDVGGDWASKLGQKHMMTITT